MIRGVPAASSRPLYAIRIVPSIGSPFTGFFHSPRSVTPLGIVRLPFMTYFPEGTKTVPPKRVATLFIIFNLFNAV